MPPSLDQDSSIPVATPAPRKGNQKGLGAGGQISTRNGKKNGQAKDNGGGGGVLAAVTKNASKIANKNLNSNSSATPVESPEMAPDESPSPSPPKGNPVTSPLLDALSSAAIAPSLTQNTNEWAKNVPAYSSSPGNLINLGESPPVLPSSYDERLASFGWTTREQRGSPNAYVSSASPRRRPLSYQTDGNYQQMPDDHRSQVPSYAARRSSLYSQQARYGPQHPPLPHHAQAHFYGAPDANLLLTPPGPGLVPGENGYYCGFDNIPNFHDPSIPTHQVIVTGYDGGLNVHTVNNRGLNKFLNLEGLRGGVYSAKILPWNTPGVHSQHFPLVVVVIHGAVSTSGGSTSGEDAAFSVDEVSAVPTGSVKGSPRARGRSIHENDMPEYYQTTVEVYSLGTKQHITTLLALPKTRLSIPSTSALFKPPPPAGTLTIHADGPNVVIAAGASGETWLFRLTSLKGNALCEFRCIGKVWTAVQHGICLDPAGADGSADGDWYSTDPVERKQYKASILSLSGRWLAYCPTAPSSQVSLRAVIPGLPIHAKVPGLNAQAPPQVPSVNCMVETLGGESMVKQIMQAGTQALIEGTTYIGKQIGKQGAQVWNNYWNRPSPPQPIASGPTYPTQTTAMHHFPPTHGTLTQAPTVAKDPGLVSILDLESLAQHASFSASPHPLATFKIPHGCSFLSFAPSGLALFTASSKGDIQSVWDLMRMQFAKSSFLKSSFQGADTRGPHVRQIAQFSRMTIARIVDVVWSSPHGERAAMVTEPGTVHILDLPASAFTWPPPRRRSPSQKPAESNGETTASGFSAAGVATSATNTINSLWGIARPLGRVRRESAAGMSAKSVTSQAGHGTQILAAGISRSLGAATGRMNEMRKAGNSKVQLPRSTTIPSKSCILLLNHKRSDSIIVVGAGIVRSYTIKNRRADRPADKQKASRGAKYKEFRLPSLPDARNVPDNLRDFSPCEDLELTEKDIVSPQWSPKRLVTQGSQGTESSIPQAEIESNAPYQPFHTDRRISLFIYGSLGASEDEPSVSALFSPPLKKSKQAPASSRVPKNPWAFGGPIETTGLNVGPSHVAEDDLDSSVDHRALPASAIERILMVRDTTEDMEQIVITTRRIKNRPGTEPSDVDAEGFFEDDCEVLDFASQRV